MTDGHDGAPVKALARLTGVLYLCIFFGAVFGEFIVRGKLTDPTTYAATIAAHETLFRLGFAVEIFVFAIDIAVAALLYLVLAPAGRTASLVAAFFRLGAIVFFAINMMRQYEAIQIASGAAALPPETADALAALAMQQHIAGYTSGLVIFAVHLAIMGALIMATGVVPRAIGLLVVLAGGSYVVDFFGTLIFPGSLAGLAPYHLLPAVIGELALTLWLLIMGVRRPVAT